MSWLGLSDGQHKGTEWIVLNPLRDDHSLGSFSINTASGEWADFATGDKGGDLVSLAAYVWGMKQGEAGRQLAAKLGLSLPATHSTRKASTLVSPVPDNAPELLKAHLKLGRPSKVWQYLDAQNRLLFAVYRFDLADGGKEIRPLSLWCSASGALAWQWKGLPTPRPLYGLDRLASLPNAPVLVCEGEKAADAAAKLFPDHVAMASPNGSKAADKADWKPLNGRECTVWPDADTSGERYAADVCQQLRMVGVKSLASLRTGLFLTLPNGGDKRQSLPEGWDAADAVAEAYTPEHIAQLGKAVGGCFAPFEMATQTVNFPNAASSFILDDNGVWFQPTEKNGSQPPPRWVCTPLEILALTRDPQGKGWGKLVEFNDPDGITHREIVPDASLCGEGADAERLLRSCGLRMVPRSRALLINFLTTQHPPQRVRLAKQTGWHGTDEKQVYVLPDRAYGSKSEEWLYEDVSGSADYRHQGTLKEWQQEVSCLCEGNSRLVFVVSLAFAAPLLKLIGGESGGFHLTGESGDGKTTALRVAASVCGGPDYMRQWRTSDNSMEYLAQQHCDAPLLLDELAQMNAKILGETIYMMGNSSGKSRARAQGGLRETMKWRMLFISSGEVGLAAHVANAGLSATAGMEGRMAEIPARVCDDPPGIYENLHDEATPKALSQRLSLAVRQYHGTAFDAFLKELVKYEPEKCRTLLLKGYKLFTEKHLSTQAGSQVARVADRCALIGVAGELATYWGITGWRQDEANKQAGKCFQAWLKQRGGEGNQEERAMIYAVRGFLERHGVSRFADWRRSPAKDTHAPNIVNRAGWRRVIDAETGRIIEHSDGIMVPDNATGGITEYLILPQVFKEEVSKGYNYLAVAKVLANHDYLKREGDGRYTTKIKPPGEAHQRMYHILPNIFEFE